jgi:hypothetical protein
LAVADSGLQLRQQPIVVVADHQSIEFPEGDVLAHGQLDQAVGLRGTGRGIAALGHQGELQGRAPALVVDGNDVDRRARQLQRDLGAEHAIAAGLLLYIVDDQRQQSGRSLHLPDDQPLRLGTDRHSGHPLAPGGLDGRIQQGNLRRRDGRCLLLALPCLSHFGGGSFRLGRAGPERRNLALQGRRALALHGQRALTPLQLGLEVGDAHLVALAGAARLAQLGRQAFQFGLPRGSHPIGLGQGRLRRLALFQHALQFRAGALRLVPRLANLGLAPLFLFLHSRLKQAGRGLGFGSLLAKRGNLAA